MFRFRVNLHGLWVVALLVLAGCEDGTAADGTAARGAASAPPSASNRALPSIPEQRPFVQPDGIVLVPRKLDFGAVGHLVDREQKFKLENRTDRVIKVTKLYQSCDCIKPSFPLGEIAPGESREGVIKVRFGAAFGSFHKYVRFHIDGQENTAVLFVNAEFHPALARPNPRRFEVEGVYGKSLPSNRAEVILRRKVPRDQPLRVENVRFEGIANSKGMVKVKHERLDDDTARFIVEVSPTHPEGRVAGKVRADVEGLPLGLSIRGKVYRGLRTQPDNFQFSKIDDPASAVATVKITSTDDQPFEITNIRVDPEKITVAVEPLADGSGYRLTARLVGSSTDRKRNRSIRSKVHLETSHPDKPELMLRVHGVIMRVFPR